jgi:hypothetical protein
MAPLFLSARRFGPVIPYPESDQTLDGQGVEYRHMAVFMLVNDVWNYIEKIGVGENAEGSPAHARPNDTELGVIVKARVNHILAGLGWGGASEVSPEYDYCDLVLTAMLETDQEIHVTLPLPAPGLGEIKRTKVIEMPDALLWIVLPGTAYDIEDGALLHETELRIVRDDREMLYAVTDFARLWFGRSRASVGLEIHNVLPAHPVGSMIGGIIGHTNCSVGTAVTRRHWDFARCRMSVQTNYEEIDATLSGELRSPQGPGSGRRPVIGTADWYASQPPMIGTADYYAQRGPREGEAAWYG